MSVVYDRWGVAVHQADCLDALRDMPDASVNSVVTDPPYGLSQVSAADVTAALTAWVTGDRERVPDGAGFMGKCVHPDTDVLTTAGWVPVAKVSVNDLVASLNPETRSIEYVRVTQEHTYPFDGELLQVGGRSALQLVTPNHNVWTDLGFIRADALPRTFGLLNQGSWFGTKTGSVSLGTRAFDPVALGRFFGLWLGDGCVCHRRAQPWKQDFIAFTVFKHRKVSEIRNACADLHVYTTETVSGTGKTTFYVYDKPLRDWLSQFGGAKTKSIPAWLLNTLPPEALEAMYQGLIETDGTRQGTKRQELYYTVSDELADDVQALCLLTGRSAVKTFRPGGPVTICGNETTSEGCWVLSIIQPNKPKFHMERDGRSNRSKPPSVQKIPYTGDVHCVTLERNHIMMTRYRGRPVWTGNSWDRFVPPPAVWDQCLRVLKPGGWLLAFAGTRTADLMGLSIRLAGFEMRDEIDSFGTRISWVYGNGMPKGINVSKAIDKAAGATREAIGPGHWAGRESVNDFGVINDDAWSPTGAPRSETAPVTEAARRWSGWNTTLSPAHEPIIVARKPLVGSVVANVTAHGCGALNIDTCRVSPTGESRQRVNEPSQNNRYTNNGGTNFATLPGIRGGDPSGRWPSNVVFSHVPLFDASGEVAGDACSAGCVAGCPVAELDRQSGSLGISKGTRGNGGSVYGNGHGYANTLEVVGQSVGYGDSGGASRFFPCFRFEAKAPTAERPRVNGVAHSTVKPVGLMRWLVRFVTPPGGTVLDCFAGTGATGQACRAEGFRCVLIENDPTSIPLIIARLDAAPKTDTPPEDAAVPPPPIDLFSLLNGDET